MSEPKSDSGFRSMAIIFKIRDFFNPPAKMLDEIGIKAGFHILDYGCGPGGYIPALSEMVGSSGKIFALDINPLAIASVKKIITKKRLSNVETIQSNCDTGLPDKSIDVALLYDIFHHLEKPDKILKELHRILKPDGILSFSDHHLDESKIRSAFSDNELFIIKSKSKKTYSMVKS